LTLVALETYRPHKLDTQLLRLQYIQTQQQEEAMRYRYQSGRRLWVPPKVEQVLSPSKAVAPAMTMMMMWRRFRWGGAQTTWFRCS
jgi:hypothetical protein